MANKTERTIFVIDDDTMQLQMLNDYLSQNYVIKIHQFKTGEEAIANLHLNPDMVILDYHLSLDNSAMNGIEVLKQIKSVNPSSNVIILSGQDKISVAVECMKYGAYDYIVKSESAFARIENALTRIGEHLSTVNQLKIYKLGFRIAIAAIVVISIISIILVKMGFASAKYWA